MLPNFINTSITIPFNFALEQLKQLKIPSTFYIFFYSLKTSNQISDFQPERHETTN